MNTIQIKNSKIKFILMIVATLIFIILGLFLVVNPDYFVSDIFRNSILISVTGLTSITFFSICLIFLLKLFFTEKISLIVNEKGIIDNSSFTSVGMILWDDINSINSISIASNKFLIINVRNPHKYINNQTSFKRRLLKNTFKTYASPVSISPTIIACSFKELETLLLKAFNEYKNMTEEIFNNRKENLKQFLSSHVQMTDKNKSIEEVVQILDRYNFNNRLNQKSTLTHFVIDSAELDYNIVEKIIEFDNSIK